MSDPNSKSSDILSDGTVKDILRPEKFHSKFAFANPFKNEFYQAGCPKS
jgi:hypothetical protein